MADELYQDEPEYEPAELSQEEMAALANAYLDAYASEALRQVLDTEHGRAIVWAIFEWANWQQTPYNQIDAGRHSVAQWLFNHIMEVDPVAYQRMKREARDREALFENRAKGPVAK